MLRLLVSMPSWENDQTLGSDEIRQYGVTSLQVMRRLRAAWGNDRSPGPCGAAQGRAAID
jgi:hypothetical protein